jgi:hypothetical protein
MKPISNPLGSPPLSRKIDLQNEALKTLEAFAKAHCDGREQGEVYDTFVYLGARCALAAAVLLCINEPGHPNCPVCRAVDDVAALAHQIANSEEAEEAVH